MKLQSEKFPIVKIVVNNLPAYFLLDTGSFNSFVDCTQSADYNLELGGRFEKNIAGISGVDNNVYYCKSQITFGNTKFTGFLLIHLAKIRKVIYNLTGINILGILGYEHMKSSKILIDFDKNEVYGFGE